MAPKEEEEEEGLLMNEVPEAKGMMPEREEERHLGCRSALERAKPPQHPEEEEENAYHHGILLLLFCGYVKVLERIP